VSQKGFEGQVRPWHTPKKKEKEGRKGRKEGRKGKVRNHWMLKEEEEKEEEVKLSMHMPSSFDEVSLGVALVIQ